MWLWDSFRLTCSRRFPTTLGTRTLVCIWERPLKLHSGNGTSANSEILRWSHYLKVDSAWTLTYQVKHHPKQTEGTFTVNNLYNCNSMPSLSVWVKIKKWKKATRSWVCYSTSHIDTDTQTHTHRHTRTERDRHTQRKYISAKEKLAVALKINDIGTSTDFSILETSYYFLIFVTHWKQSFWKYKVVWII